MAAREFTNDTPFVAQELSLADENGRDILVVVVKATYQLPRKGRPLLADEQLPLEVAGKYNGEPGKSSFRYEPEVAPFKLATDVVLIGHAHSGPRAQKCIDVELRAGPVTKAVRVFGNRLWHQRGGMTVASDPEPFEVMPLIYERAFGGWDRTMADASTHTVDARNPVGVGFHSARSGVFVEGLPLPNLERADQPIVRFNDAPQPAGFGFIGHDWMPRRQYGGTYDQAWTDQRFPLLPKDFNPWFYSGVPSDQMVPGYLQGDEAVALTNAVPEGELNFALPGEPAPTCELSLKDGTHVTQVAPLDTLIVDSDANRLLLIWRSHFPIHRRVHEVRAVRVRPSAGSIFARRAAPAINA